MIVPYRRTFIGYGHNVDMWATPNAPVERRWIAHATGKLRRTRPVVGIVRVGFKRTTLRWIGKYVLLDLFAPAWIEGIGVRVERAGCDIEVFEMARLASRA